MWKWIFILLVVLTALGLWIILDPAARPVATQVRAQAGAVFAGTGGSAYGDSLFAPIAREFDRFANSVSSLISSATIRIKVPSVQMPR